MNAFIDNKQTDRSKVIDIKSQSNTRALPYIRPNKYNLPAIKIKHKLKSNQSANDNETHIRRYVENDSITYLSVRFASSQSSAKKNDQQYYFKKSKTPQRDQTKKQNTQQKDLPYLNYKKTSSPEQYLKNLGYNPDIRLASQIYSDKVQEKKFKYLNKMQSLRRELDSFKSEQRSHRNQKCRIQMKILGEEIRRKRERDILIKQERKGRHMLNSLLSSNQLTTIQ